jgi:serine/threonine protein kinase
MSSTKTTKVYGSRWQIEGDMLGVGGQGSVFKVLDRFVTDPLDARVEGIREELVKMQPGYLQQVANVAAAIGEAIRASRNYVPRFGALKVLHTADNAGDFAKALQRMEREIEVYETIEHPNLLKILDKNIGERWFVVDYQAGGTLEAHIERYKGDLLGSLRAIRPIVEVVSQLHRKGAVHRDIKPGNIFIGREGQLILGDAGLVFFVDDRTRITEKIESVGTHQYMPPWAEGCRVEDVKENFDVFSLGRVIWAMVSGKTKTSYYWDAHREHNEVEFMFRDDPTIRWARRIFDRSVVADESECWSLASDLLSQVDAVIRVIERGGQVLDKDLARNCTVCGIGQHNLFRGGTQEDASRFGLFPKDQTVHHIFSCDHCGHSEIFRWDNPTVVPEAWKKKPPKA